MTLEQRVKALAKQYDIQPRREQGQNFVIKQEVLDAMVEAAELTPEDTVIEIGPGFGTLTMGLGDKAGSVIAIEQDWWLIKAVEALKSGYPNIHPIKGDVREVHVAQALEEFGQGAGYKLVSNLPYSISSWVLRQFLEYEPRPSKAVLMLQKEVAQRAIAGPGAMSMLSVAVQLFSKPRILREIPSSAFWPAPAVDSAILVLDGIATPTDVNAAHVLRIAKVGFASKRKQIRNNIERGTDHSKEEIAKAIEKVGLLPTARAQELSMDQWKELSILLPE